jgi:hypothetical protein
MKKKAKKLPGDRRGDRRGTIDFEQASPFRPANSKADAIDKLEISDR